MRVKSPAKRATKEINFTKRSIDALAVPTEARATIYDTQVRGLGLKIEASGHRSFFWFRKLRGRPTWKTLGTYPELSIEKARAASARLNSDSADWKAAGYVGPRPARFAERRAPTLNDVLERYVEEHLMVKAKDPGRGEKAARYAVKLSGWGSRKLVEIDRGDVGAKHRHLGKARGHYRANRMMQHLRALFNFARDRGLFTSENPFRGFDRFLEQPRARFVQPDEFPKLFKALRDEPNTDLRDFVFLALFTGARRANVLAMRWSELSETAAGERLWTIEDPKSRKPYSIPLIDEAMQVLLERRHRVPKDCVWVFPSASRQGHVLDLKRSWDRFRTKIGMKDLRVHDLRRTLGSFQAALGASELIIGKSLGHKPGSGATHVYSQLQLDPVRASITAATNAMHLAAERKEMPALQGKK
jgi:integrase